MDIGQVVLQHRRLLRPSSHPSCASSLLSVSLLATCLQFLHHHSSPFHFHFHFHFHFRDCFLFPIIPLSFPRRQSRVSVVQLVGRWRRRMLGMLDRSCSSMSLSYAFRDIVTDDLRSPQAVVNSYVSFVTMIIVSACCACFVLRDFTCTTTIYRPLSRTLCALPLLRIPS